MCVGELSKACSSRSSFGLLRRTSASLYVAGSPSKESATAVIPEKKSKAARQGLSKISPCRICQNRELRPATSTQKSHRNICRKVVNWPVKSLCRIYKRNSTFVFSVNSLVSQQVVNLVFSCQSQLELLVTPTPELALPK